MTSSAGTWTTRAASFVLLAAAAAATSRADDSAGDPVEPPPFSYPFGASVTRIAAMPDDGVALAGSTLDTALLGVTSAPAPGVWGTSFHWFASSLAPDGAPRWTSFATLRGYATSPTELAVGDDGSIWVGGTGRIVPVGGWQFQPASLEDAALARFAPDGRLAFASPYGGSGYDGTVGLVALPGGDAVVALLTDSPDFPGAPRTSGWAERSVVVARVRGDGSGVVWSRRIEAAETGGEALFTFAGAGLAHGTGDGSLVLVLVTHADLVDPPAFADLGTPAALRVRRPDRSVQTWILRLGDDGATRAAARLRGLWTSARSVARVAVGVDGGDVLVGGDRAVVRLAADLRNVRAAWADRGRRAEPYVRALVPVAGTDEWLALEGGLGVAWEKPGGLRVLRPGSRGTSALGPTPVVASPWDAAADGRGNLLLVSLAPALRFNDPAPEDDRDGGFVARLPVHGPTGPSRVDAEVMGAGDVALTWPEPAVAPVALEVERLDPLGGLGPERLASLAPDARSTRVTVLAPGPFRIRLVSVYADGLRAAVETAGWTPPRAPRDVAVDVSPAGGLRVAWTNSNADVGPYLVTWRVERQLDGGPWSHVALAYDSPAIDAVGGWPSSEVIYRVRAEMTSTLVSPWVAVPAPSAAADLVIRQARGRIAFRGEVGSLAVAGRVERADGAALSFDPSRERLVLRVGDVGDPRVVRIDAGDPGWTAAGRVLRWRAADSLSAWDDGSEVVLDLARGTWRVHLESRTSWSFRQATPAVVAELTLGDLVGAEVRSWRGRVGEKPSLRLP